MKKSLCLLLCILFLTTPVKAAETNSSWEMLQNIWSKYPQTQRFSAYGGMLADPVEDDPGVLDMKSSEELKSIFLLPVEYGETILEGASLVHLMSRNIFTAAVVKIARDGDLTAVFSRWRDNIQRNHWIGGRPERVILARVEGAYLLMAFGSRGILKCFENTLMETYPSAQILYRSAVTG